MPFVKIDLFEGRTQEQKAELAREVTEVVSRIAKAPKEAIHVFINDMPEGTYYPHGEMKKKNFFTGLKIAFLIRKHYAKTKNLSGGKACNLVIVSR